MGVLLSYVPVSEHQIFLEEIREQDDKTYGVWTVLSQFTLCASGVRDNQGPLRKRELI